MRFARWTFRFAGLYGLVLLTPFYFLENAVGRTRPISHPEYFYGFVGVALAAQLLFLLISTDPERYRGAMVIAALGKISFGISAWALYLSGRSGGKVVSLASIDLAWAALFLAAFWKTSPRRTAFQFISAGRSV